MDSLFDALPTNKYEPLPVRMRPTELDHLYGQEQAEGDIPSRHGGKGYNTIYVVLRALWNW